MNYDRSLRWRLSLSDWQGAVHMRACPQEITLQATGSIDHKVLKRRRAAFDTQHEGLGECVCQPGGCMGVVHWEIGVCGLFAH